LTNNFEESHTQTPLKQLSQPWNASSRTAAVGVMKCPGAMRTVSQSKAAQHDPTKRGRQTHAGAVFMQADILNLPLQGPMNIAARSILISLINGRLTVSLVLLQISVGSHSVSGG
jgi:hypothetical protein